MKPTTSTAKHGNRRVPVQLAQLELMEGRRINGDALYGYPDQHYPIWVQWAGLVRGDTLRYWTDRELNPAQYRIRRKRITPAGAVLEVEHPDKGVWLLSLILSDEPAPLNRSAKKGRRWQILPIEVTPCR